MSLQDRIENVDLKETDGYQDETERYHDNLRSGRLKNTSNHYRKREKYLKLREIEQAYGADSKQFKKRHKRIMQDNAPKKMNSKHRTVKLIAYIIALFTFASGMTTLGRSVSGLNDSFLWGLIKIIITALLVFGVKFWQKRELLQYNYPDLMVQQKVDKSDMGIVEKVQVTIEEFFDNIFSKKSKDDNDSDMNALIFGKQLANKMKLWSGNDNKIFSAEAYQDTKGNIYFHTENAPADLTQQKLLDASKEIKDEYGIVTVRDGRQLTTNENGRIQFEIPNSDKYMTFPVQNTMLLMKHNPLEDGFVISDIDEIEVKNEGHGVEVYNSIDINNEIVPTVLKEYAGVTIGGVPGSGKSAFLITLCSALLKRDLIDLTIIDLKGTSTDWNAFEGLANVMQLETNYDTGETNLQEILDTITDFANGTEERMKAFTEENGTTNFWHVPVTPKHKIRMIVLDECQEVFNTQGASSSEEKQIMQKIERQATRIVKKHRSLGGIAVFATQSVTRENLPIDIRRNSGLRIAFRMTESTAEAITLGDAPKGTTVFATDIGSNIPGTAVIADETGKRRMIRYAFIGGKDLENEMQKVKQERQIQLVENSKNETDADRERRNKINELKRQQANKNA